MDQNQPMDTNQTCSALSYPGDLSPSDRALVLEYKVKVGCATLARKHGTYALAQAYETQATDRLAAMTEAGRAVARAR